MPELDDMAQVILKELDNFAENFEVDGHIAAVFEEQLRLAHEPFIGYLKVVRENRTQHLFVSRHGTPRLTPTSDDVEFVSHMAPVGMLTAAEVGQVGNVVLPEGQTEGVEVKLKNAFRPTAVNHVWDAQSNQVSSLTGPFFLASLRQYLLDQKEAAVGRRPVRDRMALRDQIFLDRVQDDVFRLAIGKTIIITGAPGTGKTTVLIRRISQKTKVQFLTAAESVGVSPEQMDFLFAETRSWVLFSPSSLLKSYLKEAISRELLPAFDERVVVWEDFKKRVLRDDLGYFSDGQFSLSVREHLFKDRSSAKMTEWTGKFASAFPKFLAADLENHTGTLSQKIHGVLPYLLEVASSFIQKSESILLGAVGQSPAFVADAEGRSARAKETCEAIRLICNVADGALGLIGSVNREQGAESIWYVRQGESISVQIYQLEQRRPEDLDADQSRSLNALVSALKAFVDKLSIENVLSRIPDFYQRFRTTGAQLDYFAEPHVEAVKQRKLDPQEMDVLLYMALTVSRQVFDKSAPSLPGGNSRQGRLTRNFRTVVGIDEATDFSAVEIACMRLIAHPKFDSVTIVGDPMQRLTDSGIEDVHELESLLPSKPEPFELNVAYRQSAKLLEVASDLFQQSMRRTPPFKSAFASNPLDPKPLAARLNSDKQAAEWIAQRIFEIHHAAQSRQEAFPSIAVLVPSDESLHAVYAELQPILEERAIDTTACYGGEVLGSEARVRVFNVKYIKGLEFEAVFLVHLDELAQQSPGLVDKFLYVALTRASNYLAVTFKQDFPTQFALLRRYFHDGTWGETN